MTLSNDVVNEVTEYVDDWLVRKIAGYRRETANMPFLSSIVRDPSLVSSYSITHSLATAIGMGLYEQISEMIATPNCDEVELKRRLPEEISPARRNLITTIVGDLQSGNRTADRNAEREEILTIPNDHTVHSVGQPKVYDLYLRRDGEEWFFDLKTVKLSLGGEPGHKQVLLEWIARENRRINAMLAFPYNPYEPEPFETRFTMRGILGRNEYMVGQEYWDFLGGPGAYPQVLSIFDQVGRKHWNELNHLMTGN